jgi:hypothetical protein
VKVEGVLGKAKEETRGRHGLKQVEREIANSEFVVLLDDFHYMPRDLQTEVAKSLKEAIRLGIKIVTAAVVHRGDDVLRANPELRGRIRSIDLMYWTPAELRSIATTGFALLKAQIDQPMIERFVVESAGSPQLMQLLCLNACFVCNLREPHQGLFPFAWNTDEAVMERIFEQTSTSTDFRSLFNVVDAGPRVRGTERKTYKFHDGMEGDVYRVVLRAVAADPPRLSFPYEELLKRSAEVCVESSPIGSSLTGTCLHISRLAIEKFPLDRVVDWDEAMQVLDIPDPYFMFYLRWSGQLKMRWSGFQSTQPPGTPS